VSAARAGGALDLSRIRFVRFCSVRLTIVGRLRLLLPVRSSARQAAQGKTLIRPKPNDETFNLTNKSCTVG
jgi:hypothetical protein